MTLARVITTRRADDDVDGAITRYLGEAGPTVAMAFIDDLQRAMSRSPPFLRWGRHASSW